MPRDSCGRSTVSFPTKMERNNNRFLGSGCNREWLQTRVCQKTTIFRDQGNKSSFSSKRFDRKRNRSSFGKKCNRNSTRTSNSVRFLQYVISSPKEKWGNETCDQSKTSQQLSRKEAFQNGHNNKGDKSGEKGRLEHQFGSKRCLFSHKSVQETQKVSQVQFSECSIPVSSTMFRTNISSKSVHGNSSRSSSLSETSKHKTSIIFGRLVCSKSKNSGDTSRQIKDDQSPFSPGVYHKQKEIRLCTQSESNIYRGSVQPQIRSSLSLFRKNPENERQSASNAAGSEHGQRFSDFAGHDGILSGINTECTIIHETCPTSSSTLLESSQNVYEAYDSGYSRVGIKSCMVVTGSKHSEGSRCATECLSDYSNHRCEQFRLGRSHEESNGAGSMVQNGKDGTHKLPRNEGCIFHSETISVTAKGSECPYQIRQHNSGSVLEQTRGYEVGTSLPVDLGSLAASTAKQHRVKSCTYSGEKECFGRHTESSENSADRMGTQQSSCASTFQSLGNPIVGSVRNMGKQKDTPILLMDKSSTGICSRCSVDCMEQNVCLCIPTDTVDFQNVGTSTKSVPLHSHSDSSMLAKTVLVSSSVGTVDSTTCVSTVQSESVVPSKRKNFPSGSRNTKPDCMAGIDRKWSTEGFSKQTRKLLTASWRQGTQKDYKCKFRQFCNWCGQQEVDPYSASLTDCAHFLTYLFFEKNLKYRTINGYRSMLSSVLPPIDKCPIGQHPYIIRLLKGIFNERPPVKKLTPEWDLPLVLGCLQRCPFEPMREASLKYVTWKTCFLLAITTFQRCSDLQALQLGENNVNVQKKGVTFIRTGLSKTDRPGHMKTSVFVPAFTCNKLLDPKRSLSYYLKKTEKFREDDSSEVLRLFLAINKPHKAVSRQTISRWLVDVIRFCYQKQKKKSPKVKGHSTRSIGPSWALFKGASLIQIMESADWTNESTFVKHYLKAVNTEVLNC